VTVPLEAAPEPVSPWCPGGGGEPAGLQDHTLRFVYGGGCPVCKMPVTVDQNWKVRPHYTRDHIHGKS